MRFDLHSSVHKAGASLKISESLSRSLSLGRSMLMPRAKTGFKLDLAGILGSEDSNLSFGYPRLRASCAFACLPRSV